MFGSIYAYIIRLMVNKTYRHFFLTKKPIMKKLLMYSFILCLSIAFISCSKNQDASITYSMNADINGGHFSAQGAAYVVAVLSPNPADHSKQQLAITGTSNNSHIFLTIENYSASKSTYVIDLTGDGALAVYSAGTGPDLIANSGSLTLNQSGSNFIGSFNFGSASGFTATNGTFTAKGN